MVEETNITHADLCNLWPSDGELAADLKVAEITESMVTQWRRRNFIPPWWWAEVLAAVERVHRIVISYEQMTAATRFRAMEFRARYHARRRQAAAKRKPAKDAIHVV